MRGGVCYCDCTVGGEDKLIDAISILKERAENEEAQRLFTLCNDLSKVHSLLLYVCLYTVSLGIV